MAATSLPRSRSPVLSIRTQKEDEDTLRAQIAAANRTQHEILPRYSWHQGPGKRISPNNLRERTRAVGYENTSPEQFSSSATAVEDVTYDQASSQPRIVAIPKFAFLRSATKGKKPWKQLSRRKQNDSRFEAQSAETNEPSEEITEPVKTPRFRSQRSNRQPINDKDLAVHGKESDPWSQEELEDGNILAGLPVQSLRKTHDTIRKSVHGSLCSTKSFFRNASKTPLKRLHSHALSDTCVAPHVYSFDNKDQLRDYLNDVTIVSPLSPTDNLYRAFDVVKVKEPAELSAGPLPAELEGNGPHLTLPEPSSQHSVSSPSIRDLPPYVDDKKFCSDMVKEQSRSSEHNDNELLQKPCTLIENSFTCSSCTMVVAAHEVYDFCSICDTGDRVLCTKCAERGPCCQHELEQLLNHGLPSQPMLSNPTNTEGTDLNIEQSTETNHHLAKTGSRIYSTTENQPRCPTTSALHNVETTQQQSLKRDDDSIDKLRIDFQNLQFGLVTEMSYMRREQDLMQRERELALRIREVDLKGHEVTLREREAIVQRDAQAVNKNLERLLSHQMFAKSAFIGSQFDSESSIAVSRSSSKPTTQSGLRQTIAEVNSQHHYQHHCDKAFEAISRAEASLLDPVNTESRVKSYTAQKRKKNTSNSSTGSTPAASSSPAQSRKSLSRGNSERDASQDDGDEEGDDRRRSPKKQKAEFATPEAPAVLFACPYAKHDPTRFSSRNTREKNYRGCATHYLPDVSRLKQHLKRVHWQPEVYCPRCYEEFEHSAKLAEHAGLQVACASRACPFPEKMDKTKQDKIHVKRPKVPQDVVWYDIYKVLFPGSPLPESPYMDSEERIVTPISATPHSSANMQAIQMLSSIFNNRLNQHDTLKNHPSRDFIEKTLMDSFADVLNVFSISPAASPAAGPSIVVSPVTRTPSGTTQSLESPVISNPKPDPEDQSSVPTVAAQSQEVPRLQQPRPPRPKVRTALEVPRDHHRSLSGQHSRSDSVSSSSRADVVFDVNILPHVQNDPGYGEECLSFEQGDDLQAMAFIREPTPPFLRNKSIMSIDSGYGSGRSQQRPTFQQNPLPTSAIPLYEHNDRTNVLPLVDKWQLYNQKGQSDFPEASSDYVMPDVSDQHVLPDQQLFPEEHSAGNFQSYSNFLDQTSQDEINDGFGYSFSVHHNPWSYQ